jgi:hypothetical protein
MSTYNDDLPPIVDLLSEDSTIALGQSSSSMEFEDNRLNEKVDLVTTTLGSNPPVLPLREERMSLGVETVFKAKGVGWQGVRKKYTHEKKMKEEAKLTLGCSYVISWDSCRSSKSCLLVDDESTICVGNSQSKKGTNSNEKDFKALTYEEYLEFLRRCQEKMKESDTTEYLELEVNPEESNLTNRRQRIFTRELSDMRDDRYGNDCQPLVVQDMRDFPASLNICTSSFFGEDCDPPTQESALKRNEKRVSFASFDDVKTIPCRSSSVNNVVTTESTTAHDEKSVKDEILHDKKISPENQTESENEVLDEINMKPKQSITTQSCNIAPQNDDLSPRSRIEISRGTNLLDVEHVKETPTKGPIESKNKQNEQGELSMLKRALINVQPTKSKNLSITSSKGEEEIESVRSMQPENDQVCTNEWETSYEKTRKELSPVGKSAAADLAKTLLRDIENVRTPDEEIKENLSRIRSHGTTSLTMSNPQPIEQFNLDGNENKMSVIQVDPNLLEQRAKHTIESIGLAKKILDEVRTSLDEEEEAISRPSSFDSFYSSSSKASSRSALKEVNGEELSLPQTDLIVQLSHSGDGSASPNAINRIKFDPELREDQSKLAIDSRSLSRIILDEVQASLNDEEKAMSQSSSSLDSTTLTPAMTLSRSILKEVNSQQFPPFKTGTKRETTFVAKLEPTTAVEHIDIMKVDSDLREEQIRRKAESISLSKMVLNEVHASIKEDEEEETTSTSSSFDSTTATPAMILARSILKEVKGGQLLPPPLKIKEEIIPAVVVAPQPIVDSVDIMRVNSELHEEQARRALESISLSKRILDEMQVSLEEEEVRIVQSISEESSSSCSPSNSFEKQASNEEEVDTKGSHRTSPTSCSQPQVRIAANMNHPAELAQRRAEDIRARHSVTSTGITRSTSHESEDSWSQPIDLHGLRNDVNSWNDENESISISSIEKAEFARRLIEEATIRHNKLSSPNSEAVESDSDTTHSPDLHKMIKTLSLDEGDKVDSAVSEKGKNCTKLESIQSEKSTRIEEKPNKFKSQSSVESIQSVESMESFSSCYSEDSMNNLSEEDQQTVKQSTELAKRLLQNAKIRLHEVRKPSSPRTNPPSSSDSSIDTWSQPSEEEEESLDKAFQGSSELSKRLLHEAFFTPKTDVTNPQQKPASLFPEEESTQDHSNVTRQIMDDAGFTDLFSPLEEGSFDKMMKYLESESESESGEDTSSSDSSESGLVKQLDSFEYFQRSILGSIKEETEKKRIIPSPQKLNVPCHAHQGKDLVSPTKSTSDFSFKSCVSSLGKIPEVQESPKKISMNPQPNLVRVAESGLPHESVSQTESHLTQYAKQSNIYAVKSATDSEGDFSEEFKYSIPQSFSMTSCNSGSTSGYSIKSSKSIDEITAEFEIEESLSFTVNELNRINSMLEDAESSCHSSKYCDERDALFFAKQSKEEIAALAKAIENKVNAEQFSTFENTPQVSQSYTNDSCDSSSYRRIKRVGSPLKQDRMAKSPAMDQLIEEVNELCNQIEARIDNIVNDTQS